MTNNEFQGESFFSLHKMFWFLIYLTCIWGSVDMLNTAWEVWEGEPFVQVAENRPQRR